MSKQMENIKKYSTQRTKKLQKNRSWGVAALIFLGLIFLIFAFFLANPPKVYCALNGVVAFPSNVKRGELFDIAITVTNPTNNLIYINHVVLHSYNNMQTLLDGASVIGTEPAMASEPMRLFPSDIQFAYFQNIDSRESQKILFHMQAEKIGIYSGNIGIYTEDLECAFHYQNVEIEISP
jgi:hypothetical protein